MVQVRFVIDEIFRLLMDVWVLQFFIVSGQVLEISDILLFRFAHFEEKKFTMLWAPRFFKSLMFFMRQMFVNPMIDIWQQKL